MTQELEPTSRWVLEDGYFQYSDWFNRQVDQRIENGQNVIACFTGSLGSGKTYMAGKICEMRDPNFTIDATVFNAEQFWQALRKDGPGWTLWDEPNKGLSNRRWYEDLNQAITLFIQTATRYRKKHILFALPSFDLLDKNVRRVTLFEGRMVRPGLSKIYKLEPNGFGSPEFWKQLLGQVEAYKPSQAWQTAYGPKRDAFHDTDYPDNVEAVTVKPKSKMERDIDRVMDEVKLEPSRYLGETLKDGKARLSLTKIGAFCHCTDHVARAVRALIEG